MRVIFAATIIALGAGLIGSGVPGWGQFWVIIGSLFLLPEITGQS